MSQLRSRTLQFGSKSAGKHVPATRHKIKWRAKWRYDTNKVERAYPNDAERPAALKRDHVEIEAYCEKSDDPKAQAEARVRWIYSERCATAKADLEAVEKPEAKNPKSTIEGKARVVERYCET